MGRNILRIVWRWLWRALLALVALIVGYAASAAIGSSIPVNGGWSPPTGGVSIYVMDNGVHTDLVLPVTAAGVDWRDLVRPEHVADPRQAGRSHLAFGWGNRDFYLNTPSWSQLRVDRLLVALIGVGRTVLHVDHVSEPGSAPHIRSVMLRPDEYRRLAAYVRATFAGGAPVHGYGDSDAFYEARGGYSALDTCNQWTGGALRTAGVKMGAWTPLTVTVMRWL